MTFRRQTSQMIFLAAFAMVVLGAFWLTQRRVLAADPFRNVARAKGFKWAPGYYPATNGVQHPMAMVTGSEGRFLSNNIVFVSEPRIESFRQDGSLEWVATALDAFVNMTARTASGTNVICFRTADTNLYLSGRGFLWQQTNRVLILSNQTYTWFDRTTNAPALR